MNNSNSKIRERAGVFGWLFLALASAIILVAFHSRSIDRTAWADETDERQPLAELLLNCEIVDLSHSFDEQTIFWPTEPGFQLERGPSGVTEKGYFYAANRFRSAEHGGTHIDAPIHFFEGRRTVDQIPLEQLVAEAAVVDVTRQCRDNADYLITIDDLRSWEQQHQRRLDGLILLLRTGFGAFWPDRQRYLGTEERGADAIAKLHFPGLAAEAARWLSNERRVKAVGIDTASIDYGQSMLFESHQILFEKNVPVFENVAQLDRLPTSGATIVALPMKIGTGTGAPLRIAAFVGR